MIHGTETIGIAQYVFSNLDLKRGNLSCVKLLLDNGADPRMKTKFGTRPSGMADDYEIKKFLLTNIL